MSGIAYTKSFTATEIPEMILGKDGNRLELTIFNLSDDQFLHIGFGTEVDLFDIDNTLPLAPGEAYDASVPPVSAVWLLAPREQTVNTVVYYSTQSPAYVRGCLSEGGQ